VGAGVHEKVLVVIEGRAAGEALGRKAHPLTRRSLVSWTTWTPGMTEQELRALVRDAIAKHTARMPPIRSRRERRPLACTRVMR
jgi:hypothetical protein